MGFEQDAGEGTAGIDNDYYLISDAPNIPTRRINKTRFLCTGKCSNLLLCADCIFDAVNSTMGFHQMKDQKQAIAEPGGKVLVFSGREFLVRGWEQVFDCITKRSTTKLKAAWPSQGFKEVEVEYAQYRRWCIIPSDPLKIVCIK